ncbi:MAG: hypothetical protein COB51_03600 [Moraxellaceae bacterium]|nr:MAG: hypothetical protein COB51_03600 [Moraxellaceae bacterium]
MNHKNQFKSLKGNPAKIGLLVLSLLLSGLGWANNDDPISMGSIVISKKINDYSIYGVSGEIRDTIEGQLAILGVSGKINDQWRWHTEYFGLFTERATGDLHDNRGRVALTYSQKFEDWRFSFRPLLEYINSEVENGFRLRPNVSLSHSLTLKEQDITPFVRLEPFYEQKTELVTMTLFTLGARWAIDSNIYISGSYIRGISHQRNTDIEGPSASLIIRL